jgi:ferrous iron transport protein A
VSPGRAGPEGRARVASRTLDALSPGEAGVVERLVGDARIARRLMELGLTPGTDVEVVRCAPLGDPIELRLREVHLSIRRSEAAHIHVRPR